jgi:ABC-type Fe3+-siderophore transport system permease subunit
MTRIRLGMICCVIGAFGLVFALTVANSINFPRYFRLFALVGLFGDVYGFCFFLWLLRRLKKASTSPPPPQQFM